MLHPDLLPLFPDQGKGGSSRMAAMVRAVVESGHQLHRRPLNRADEDAMGETLPALTDLASDLEAAAEEALERHDNPDTFGDRADYLHEERIAHAMLGQED